MEQAGTSSVKPINVHEYEALAQSRLDANTWGYYYGGSDDEVTLRANRTAFERPCQRLSLLLLDAVRSILMVEYDVAQIF